MGCKCYPEVLIGGAEVLQFRLARAEIEIGEIIFGIISDSSPKCGHRLVRLRPVILLEQREAKKKLSVACLGIHRDGAAKLTNRVVGILRFAISTGKNNVPDCLVAIGSQDFPENSFGFFFLLKL
jgi:hypothetical protein